MSEALKVNTTLKALHLESVQQQDEARQWLNFNSHDKAGSGIRSGGTRILSEALEVNTTLVSLCIRCVCSNNKMEPNQNTTATSKTDNEIGAEGTCALSEELMINETLTELDMGRVCAEATKGRETRDTNNGHKQTKQIKGNNIRDGGARALSEALKVNTTLKILGLGCPSTRQSATLAWYHQKIIEQRTGSRRKKHVN